MTPLHDVWDAGREEVRPVIALLEKGSKFRRNVPNQRLRTALRTYIQEELLLGGQGGLGDWLFPQYHCPRLVSRHCAEHTIQRLCRTIGLHGVSPHSFRRYVVNTAMQAGNRLETVQKWLGHASATREEGGTQASVHPRRANHPATLLDGRSARTGPECDDP